MADVQQNSSGGGLRLVAPEAVSIVAVVDLSTTEASTVSWAVVLRGNGRLIPASTSRSRAYEKLARQDNGQSEQRRHTLRGHRPAGTIVLGEVGCTGGKSRIVELTSGWTVLAPLRQLATHNRRQNTKNGGEVEHTLHFKGRPLTL